MKLIKTVLYRRFTTKPSFPPGPIPLGNAKDQQEFINSVRKNESSQIERHPDAPESVDQFEGDVNPTTGEVGGPKGKEPTRYGDWERKGRVFDF
jgi:hypothetical protein